MTLVIGKTSNYNSTVFTLIIFGLRKHLFASVVNNNNLWFSNYSYYFYNELRVLYITQRDHGNKSKNQQQRKP